MNEVKLIELYKNRNKHIEKFYNSKGARYITEIDSVAREICLPVFLYSSPSDYRNCVTFSFLFNKDDFLKNEDYRYGGEYFKYIGLEYSNKEIDFDLINCNLSILCDYFSIDYAESRDGKLVEVFNIYEEKQRIADKIINLLSEKGFRFLENNEYMIKTDVETELYGEESPLYCVLFFDFED